MMATRKKTKAPRKQARKPAVHRDPVDEHAATELVLYIENTSELSPDGPSGQGRSVLLNALRKWRKGTYDPALGVKLFEYLAEAGAKSYSKEYGPTTFNPATRHEAARQLEMSFRHSVEHGEYDHVETKYGAREAEESHVDARGKTRLDKLRADLPPGYSVETYSPGDGVTRYRFFKNAPAKQDYFGPDNGIYTALGYKEAETFASGLEHHGGREAHEPPGVEAPRRRAIQVGDKVRFTKKYLQNTGQYTGHDANGRWEVLEIRGSFAFVNQPSDTSYFTPTELQADPMLKWRAINVGNLEIA